jgi:hypothetical protein
MRWTDTHCHLNHPDLYPEWQAALFRAQQSGVERLILIGYDLESSRRAVELAAQSDALYAAVGIHPHDAAQCDADALATLRQLAQQPRVVAVGEIGLDFYRDLSPRAAQYEAFHAQMQLAQSLGLPVILHCRDAYDELLGVLEEYPAVRGVLHCFSGTAAHAQRGLELGYYLGDWRRDYLQKRGAAAGDCAIHAARPPAAGDRRALPRTAPLSRQAQRTCLPAPDCPAGRNAVGDTAGEPFGTHGGECGAGVWATVAHAQILVFDTLRNRLRSLSR